jgi:hypothetical protein
MYKTWAGMDLENEIIGPQAGAARGSERRAPERVRHGRA